MSFEEILELKNLINSVPGDKIARFNELFEKALKDAAADAIDKCFKALNKNNVIQNENDLIIARVVLDKLKEQVNE